MRLYLDIPPQVRREMSPDLKVPPHGRLSAAHDRRKRTQFIEILPHEVSKMANDPMVARLDPVVARQYLQVAPPVESAMSSATRSVLAEQKDKIGLVAVTTNVKEGVVEIDNVDAGKLPLTAPLEVASGRHIIGVISPGYAPSRQHVTVASHERVEAHLELVAIEGRLAHVSVSSRIPRPRCSWTGRWSARRRSPRRSP
jgi:hypothetical protein